MRVPGALFFCPENGTIFLRNSIYQGKIKMQNQTIIRATGDFHPGVRGLLADYHDNGEMTHADEWLQETAEVLERALRSYHMKAEIKATRLTPNAALVLFKGNDNISVDRIEKKRSYLYTTWGLDISAVRPGKGYIAVMVKRDSRHVTDTGLIWAKRELPETAPYYNTSFVIGEREDTGELLYLNVSRAFAGQPASGPHTLIAGESGGGKGVLASNLIMDICATNSPEMARIHMIDPKSGCDYQWLEKMPHLQGEIVTEPADSQQRYTDILMEMERRYQLLSAARARDLDTYNDKVRDGQITEARTVTKIIVDGEEETCVRVEEAKVLPRIYIIHDELADWMTDDDYRNDTGKLLARISAKGRAAGMHLILITQRPDKKAMPGMVKANISNKICLRVSNKVNSNVVIDEAGAEELMGAGHMLAIIGGVPGGAVFAQSSYLDPWDAELMAEAIAADYLEASNLANDSAAVGEDNAISIAEAVRQAA